MADTRQLQHYLKTEKERNPYGKDNKHPNTFIAIMCDYLLKQEVELTKLRERLQRLEDINKQKEKKK